MLKLEKEHKIFILFFILFATFTKHNLGSVNDAAVYATIESLVERGTFAIDDSTFNWTIDKIYVNGHFYGLKPFLSIMGAVSYLILYNVLNISFTNAPEISYYTITLFTVGLTSAILMAFFYKSLAFVSIDEKFKYLLTFALGTGTLIFPYTVTLNMHTVSASFLLIGFYFLLSARFSEKAIKKKIFFSAIFISFSSLISVPEILFVLLFFLYILSNEKLKKFWWIYLYTSTTVLMVSFIINIVLTGYFLPNIVLFYLKPEVQHYPGSYWNNPQGIDALNDPIYLYIFNVLFGHHGIFTFTPVLIFSFLMLLKIAINKKHLFFKESIFVSTTIATYFLIFILLSSLNYSAYGGVAVGFRYFIPLIPLMLFFTAFLFKEIKSKIFYRIFYVLLFVSVVMSFIGTGLTGFYPFNCTNCPWFTPTYDFFLTRLFFSAIAGIFLIYVLPSDYVKKLYLSITKFNKFNILLSLVLLVGLFTRIYALFKTGGIIHPDELYQYIEQPHRLIFGYGIVPWEFIDGARSWFYPLIIYLIFKTNIFMGFGQINEMIFSVRLFNTLFSIILIPLIYLLGKELYNKNVGLIAAFFAIFSSTLILWTARLMPEIHSTFFSTLSVFLLYTGIKNKDKIKIFMSGIFIGLSFILSFRPIVLLISFFIYSIYRKYGFYYILMGFSIILLLQGILDLYTWGSFLHSPLEFLKFNLIEDKSSLFGIEPPWFYIIYPLFFSLPLLFLIPYAFEWTEGSKYLFLNFGLYFLTFSLIPHKEERFILSILPLFLILAARGFERFTIKFSGINGRIIATGLVISLILISPLNPAIYDNSMWAPFADIIKAIEYVGLQNDSKGVAYTVSWGNSGVYTYLHKNIPTAYLTLNTTLCDDIDKNPSKYRYYFPRGFQCYMIEDVVGNPYMNYVITSSSEGPYIMPFLYENNFTEVKTFGDVSIFRR